MTWLENWVTKLSNHVDRQFDELIDKKDFEAAQDAYIAGDFKTALVSYESLAARNHGRAAALAGSMYLMGTGIKVSNSAQYFPLISVQYFPLCRFFESDFYAV